MSIVETSCEGSVKISKELEPRKIVLLSLTNRMGGAEQMLLMMAETLKSPLIFLKKIASHSLPLEAHHSIKYVTSRQLFVGFLFLLKDLYKYRKGYIIISSHAYLNAYLGALKRIGYLKSQLVARESTSLFTRFTGVKRLTYKLAYRLGYPAVDLVICQTNYMRNQLLLNNKYISDSKVITLDNSIDLKNVKQRGEESVVDELTEHDFICAAGRLIPIKGFSFLIKTFNDVTKLYPQLKLLILGEGPERENLQKLILELGLEDKVFLRGHISNPYPYFKKARVCVVSSIQEGFPNVLLQMMALNTNVVTTLCAGGIEDIPYIITAPPMDNKTLIEGILKALTEGENTSKRNRMDEYLNNRSPEKFVSHILKMVQN